jgi:N-acyl homoserine lactone hydrolase
MWALEPATYLSPLQVALHGGDAPRIPFPVFLVEHSGGLVLFDSGLDPQYAGNPAGAYGEIAERIRIDFREEHLIERQLDRLGFGLRDVETVIASHLHFDHAGALKQFPHARTYVGEGERQYAHHPERFCATWYRREDFDDRHGIQWHELPCDHDVFGDGAVTVLSMPGHSPGSLGAMVKLPETTFILTGDVVHTRAALEGEVAYPGDVDTVVARRSLRKLSHLAQVHAADVWINHDPEDWARYGGAGEKR